MRKQIKRLLTNKSNTALDLSVMVGFITTNNQVFHNMMDDSKTTVDTAAVAMAGMLSVYLLQKVTDEKILEAFLEMFDDEYVEPRISVFDIDPPSSLKKKKSNDGRHTEPMYSPSSPDNTLTVWYTDENNKNVKIKRKLEF